MTNPRNALRIVNIHYTDVMVGTIAKPQSRR